MSRKGKLPIPYFPKELKLKSTRPKLSVKGPKGTLHQTLVPGVEVQVKDDHIHVTLARRI